MSKKSIYILMVIVVTAIAFFPSLRNEFVDLDDPQYVFNNDLVKSFSLGNTIKIFTSSFVECYCPLPILSYALEYHFFNLNPFVYHFTNYLLHLFVTLCVFYFIYLVSGDLNIAFLSSALFGVHPLHVESVAWISERKDLFCAIFYLASLMAYLRYLKDRKTLYYLFCFVFALLALGSKPMAVTIPFILVLLDYFHGRKLSMTMIVEKVPIFILAAIFGAVGFYFQVLGGTTNLKATFIVKAYFLLKAIPFYLYKLILPVNLSAMYLYHDVSPRHTAEIKYYVAILIALFYAVILSRKYSKKIIFGSLFFIITLLPVLKIIPAGDSFAADRYMYLPSIGIFYIASVLFAKIFDGEYARLLKLAMGIALAMVIVSFSMLTWQRCAVWADTESLYMNILEKYPNRPALYNDLGAFFAYKGDYDKAIRCFNIALTFKPDYEGARKNLSIALANKRAKDILGKGDDYLRAQIESSIDVAAKVELLNKLGLVETRIQNFDKAIALFNEAIAVDPNYAPSYNNLGYVCYLKGEMKAAEQYFKKALELKPDYEKARNNLRYIYDKENK